MKNPDEIAAVFLENLFSCLRFVIHKGNQSPFLIYSEKTELLFAIGITNFAILIWPIALEKVGWAAL